MCAIKVLIIKTILDSLIIPSDDAANILFISETCSILEHQSEEKPTYRVFKNASLGDGSSLKVELKLQFLSSLFPWLI